MSHSFFFCCLFFNFNYFFSLSSYACIFRLGILRPNWVFDAWEKRNDTKFSATVEEVALNHKLKAFEGQRICFFGFSAEEKQHMIDILIENNGIPTDLEDPECSHVVSTFLLSFFGCF